MSSHSVIQRSFGGLTASYYFRNLFFALLLFVPMMFLVWSKTAQVKPGALGAAVGITIIYGISAALYPYSRFVYERVVGFILGDNIFSVPAVIFLSVKLMTMVACYGLAIFIAPVGLIYLYLRNSGTAS